MTAVVFEGHDVPQKFQIPQSNELTRITTLDLAFVSSNPTKQIHVTHGLYMSRVVRCHWAKVILLATHWITTLGHR